MTKAHQFGNPESLLGAANEQKLVKCVVVGVDKDGELWFGRSHQRIMYLDYKYLDMILEHIKFCTMERKK